MKPALALILTTLALPALPAETRARVDPSRCPATTAPKIHIEVPVMVGASRVNVPLCVSLGTGMVLDTTVNPPELRAAPTAAAPAPWLAVDRVDLGAANIGATQTELTYTLSKAPVEGSALFAILQGRPFGMVDVTMTAPGRHVVMALPAGPRPFVPGADLVFLVYLTIDPK